MTQAAAKDIEFKSNWNPEAGWKSAEIVPEYFHYSENISQKGLLGAKEIAKNALLEGATAN
ncbi:MAG: hypothetical protein AAFR77_01525 [Cyanobacteria bacterium J06631_2]